MTIEFLTLAEVLRLHTDQISNWGGDASIRDHGLLQSAVAMPEAAFGGQYLHGFPHEMAAAYLFHLVQNHPFVDGNKRTGLASALMFMELNGVDFNAPKKVLEDLVLAVAQGLVGKAVVIQFFRAHIEP